MRFLLALIGTLLVGGLTVHADPLTVQIQNSAGKSLASASDPSKVALDYAAAYQAGDVILVTAPAQKYLFIQVDAKLPESLVFSPTSTVTFTIPFGKFATGYDPTAFKGDTHHITARIASPTEITTYCNVALNTLDQRNLSQYFPHAIASSVTRDDPVFFERNVIDGNVLNTHHGKWPYGSWGNGLNPNPWLKIDFGRDVTVDKVRLYIRADFPHDTYWTNATIQFSDGTSQDITLQKTADPQDFTFPAKKINWIQLNNFKQPTTPLGFAAVTEMEVYGKDAAP